MALPIYRDITYYRGDTFTEKLYPKYSDGTAFSLTDSQGNAFQARFYIDLNRDSSAAITGSATVNTSDNSIIYSISSAVGSTLTADSYIYEVKIKNLYTLEVYTLVTGTITISNNVGAL